MKAQFYPVYLPGSDGINGYQQLIKVLESRANGIQVSYIFSLYFAYICDFYNSHFRSDTTTLA
jgi:hypothetical protein